jgi:hypothetical protein
MFKKGELLDATELIENIFIRLAEGTKAEPTGLTRFKEALTSYLNKRKLGVEIFFQDIDSAKELIDLCLVRRVPLIKKIINKLIGRKQKNNSDYIDYDLKTDRQIIEFDNFIGDVSNAFFLSRFNSRRK